MFSRWAQAWCRVSETIQRYGSQPSSAARRAKASVPTVDLAEPRGPSTLSRDPRCSRMRLQVPRPASGARATAGG